MDISTFMQLMGKGVGKELGSNAARNLGVGGDGLLSNIKSTLMSRPGKTSEPDLSGFVNHRGAERGAYSGFSSQYSPIKLYGELLKLYGGRRVRGGLLGE
jgi:hypothetical protein